MTEREILADFLFPDVDKTPDYYGNNRDQDEYSRASHRTCCNACYEEREEDIADTSDRITEAGTGQFCRRRPHFRNIHRGSIAYVHINCRVQQECCYDQCCHCCLLSCNNSKYSHCCQKNHAHNSSRNLIHDQ